MDMKSDIEGDTKPKATVKFSLGLMKYHAMKTYHVLN